MKDVVYFSMEYSLPEEEIPFAGGLGVLAGDYLLQAGSQNEQNFTAFGLFYMPNPYDPAERGWEKLRFFPIEISGQQYFVTAWTKNYGSAKIILFSSDDGITHHPYGPDRATMIKQQLLLALASAQLNLITNDTIVHLNEGHTSFVLVPLLKSGVKPKVVCTKHTILHEAGLFLKKEELNGLDEIFDQGTDEKHPSDFSTTKYMIINSQKGNAVSVSHAKWEKVTHPNSPLIPITNGINLERWQAKNIDMMGLSEAHKQNKKFMLDYINQNTGSALDENVLTVVWARRLASYKQPELLLSDLNYLGYLINDPEKPVQFIISGPVFPGDPASMGVAAKITEAAKRPDFKSRLAFLPRHNTETAGILTKGADIWLNTPLMGKEACGTSGMKAGLNGALMFTTNDGWVAEEDWASLGWVLPDENSGQALYDILKNEIGPLYYGHPTEWSSRRQKMHDLIAQKYSTERMWNEYVEKLYS